VDREREHVGREPPRSRPHERAHFLASTRERRGRLDHAGPLELAHHGCVARERPAVAALEVQLLEIRARTLSAGLARLERHETTVEPQAGRFILSFDKMKSGEGEIVISGKTGVWHARTHMTLGEFMRLLRMTLRPRRLGFLIRALLGLSRVKASPTG
jgi:hypothetical protein